MALRAFVVGSTPFLTVPFFLAVAATPERTFALDVYALRVPMFFGIMNVLSYLFLDRVLGIALWPRMIISAIVSAALVITLISLRGAYTFTSTSRWLLQYSLVLLGHVVAWGLIIYSLTRMLACTA